MGDHSKDAVLNTWHSFEKTWFSGADTIENLRGDEASLANSLDTLAGILPGMVTDLGTIGGSMNALAPGDEVISSDLIERLTTLEGRVGDLRIKLAAHRETTSQMGRVKNKLAASKRDHETQAISTRAVCGEAGEARKTYDAKVANIKEATNRQITKVRDNFLKEISPLFEGFSVGKGDSVEDLFDNLVEDPEYHRKAGITTKGIGIGRKKADIQVRMALLDYKGEEIATAIRPLLKDEATRIARFEEEHKVSQDLEARCAALKDTEAETESEIKILKDRLGEMEAKDKEVSGEFGTSEAILALKGTILEAYDATAKDRKRLGEVVESSLGSLVEMETDTEKRELKEKIKLLTDERGTITSDLHKTKADLERAVVDKAALEEETGKQKALIQEKDGAIAVLTGENQELATNLEKTTEEREAARVQEEKLRAELEPMVVELEGTVERYEASQKELAEMESAFQIKEDELADTRTSSDMRGTDLEAMTKERDGYKTELERTLGELEAMVERYEGACQERDKGGERIDALKTDLENTRTELEDRKKTNESARSEATELRRSLDEMSLAHDSLKADHTKLSRELEGEAAVAASTKEQLDRYKATVTDQEHENETLAGEVQKLKADIASVAGAGETAVVERDMLKAELERTVGELEKTLELYEAGKKEAEDLKDALEAGEKRYKTLEKTYDMTVQEMEAMSKEVERLETEMVARIKALEALVMVREKQPKMAEPAAKRRTPKPRPPKRSMTSEEKKVEKKIEALRKAKS